LKNHKRIVSNYCQVQAWSSSLQNCRLSFYCFSFSIFLLLYITWWFWISWVLLICSHSKSFLSVSCASWVRNAGNALPQISFRCARLDWVQFTPLLPRIGSPIHHTDHLSSGSTWALGRCWPQIKK
jgi:hypothetical protein